MDNGLSHLDLEGKIHMVSVVSKPVTQRQAIARGEVLMNPEAFRLLESGKVRKGDAFAAARIAGILGAKKTAELIPLCHPLPLENVRVHLRFKKDRIGVVIEAEAHASAKTGVEMEALTAVSIAALTLYDMLKSVDPAIRIADIHLVSKKGGKSDFKSSGLDRQ